MVELNGAKVEKWLSGEGSGAVIVIPVHDGSEGVIGQFNGELLQLMIASEAVVELRTELGIYRLPANELKLHDIAKQLSASGNLDDIRIEIEVAAPTQEQLKAAEDASEEGDFDIVAPPVRFTVTAHHGTDSIEVVGFDRFVERLIAIPDDVKPSEATTVVVIDPDGTVRHIPTVVVTISGSYYAKASSLSNSIYAVVKHNAAFPDLENHWAKTYVNDLGSRMVITGFDDGQFYPEKSITRAEFAAIAVRALGLKPVSGQSPFTDVKASDWYGSAVLTAYEFGLINGFDDGTFRPAASITREQAMVILANAMKLTDLYESVDDAASDSALHPFSDEGDVSAWAKEAFAAGIEADIIAGRSADTLAPKADISRAEAAKIMYRLLQQSGLIS